MAADSPLPPPIFCPYCGKVRPTNSAPCPGCKAPAFHAGMRASDSPVGGGVDPITFFGEDVETLLYEPGHDGGEGTYWVNPDKLRVKWQWQTGQLNNRFPFVIPANQQVKVRVRINAETGLRGDTEVGAFMLTSSAGRVAVQPFIPILEKHLSNVLIPSNLMFGTVQLQALLAETIYGLPNFDWTFDMKDLSGADNTVSPVFFSRRFTDGGSNRVQAARRAAGMSRFMHPFWLGPTTAFDNTANSAISPNPTVVVPAGHSVTVTYSVPSDGFFDWRWTLDDSSDSSDSDPADTITAQIQIGGSGRNLIDSPQGSNGISWRSFLATPTVGVTGFPSGGGLAATGGIRAASLPSPAGGWTQLVPPGTDIQITFFSTNTNSVTLRTALVGTMIYAKVPKEVCAA